MALLIAVFVWAYFAVVDVVTQAQGEVIPSQRQQLVQSLEGGIVSRILVREGDLVEEGQVVAQLDAVRFGSEASELSIARAATYLRVERLTAELTGAEDAAFEPTADDLPLELVAEEIRLFQARKRELSQDIELLEAQIAQKQAELVEQQVRVAALSSSLEIMQEELDLLRPLVESGVVARMEYLQLDRQFVGANGELQVARATIQRIEAGLSEAEDRIDQRRAAFQSAAQADLVAARADLASLDERLKIAQDRLERTEVRAPVRGIVNKIDLTTEGSVLQPGRTLMEITPIDDSLLVEARIDPRDIGFLHEGQRARIKLTAYDFTQYGQLEGEVVRIGSDALEDQNGVSYYSVIVKTDDNKLVTGGRELDIIPGMQASVDILIGERTILHYVIRPIYRVADQAFRER